MPSRKSRLHGRLDDAKLLTVTYEGKSTSIPYTVSFREIEPGENYSFVGDSFEEGLSAFTYIDAKNQLKLKIVHYREDGNEVIKIEYPLTDLGHNLYQTRALVDGKFEYYNVYLIKDAIYFKKA